MARQKPNSGEHIVDIFNRTACAKHHVPKGAPCFYIYYDSVARRGPAVCGPRIAKAGFNGQIQPNSLSRKGPRVEPRTRR